MPEEKTRIKKTKESARLPMATKVFKATKRIAAVCRARPTFELKTKDQHANDIMAATTAPDGFVLGTRKRRRGLPAKSMVNFRDLRNLGLAMKNNAKMLKQRNKGQMLLMIRIDFSKLLSTN